MIIDRISYQRVFAIGNYVTERIGLEASIDENDNPEVELSHLKQMVNELHSATIATLEEFRGTKVRDVVEEPVDKIERLIGEINKCTSIPVLETFKLLITNNPETKEAYDKKYLELSG